MGNRYSLKTYAVGTYVLDVDGYGYRRCIVAAYSQKDAMSALNVGQSYFQLHATVSCDESEREVALASPGTPFAEGVASVEPYWRPVRLDATGRRVVVQPLAESAEPG